MVIPSITLASRKWKRGKKAECVFMSCWKYDHTFDGFSYCAQRKAVRFQKRNILHIKKLKHKKSKMQNIQITRIFSTTIYQFTK